MTPSQQHPGRRKLLERAAALTDDIGSVERDTLIRLGAPGHDREHVLTTLRQVIEHRHAWRREQAEELMDQLLTPPEPAAN